MSVDDLVYTLFNQDSYEFVIDNVLYNKLSEIPKKILNKKVTTWESDESDILRYAYTLTISTQDNRNIALINHIMDNGFTMDQIRRMVDGGTELSEIVSMLVDLQAIKKIYTRAGYNKQTVQEIMYKEYADRLFQEFNDSLLK